MRSFFHTLPVDQLMTVIAAHNAMTVAREYGPDILTLNRAVHKRAVRRARPIITIFNLMPQPAWTQGGEA